MSSAQEPMKHATHEAIYYPVGDEMMLRGEGVRLYDSEGNAYIDCASATFNLSLGYSHPAVLKAIRDQAEHLVHVTSGFQTGPVNELATRLVELAPKNLAKAHLKVSGGSVANEGAIKMAQVATGRRDVITLFRSHLGQTMMMASMSGFGFRKEPFPVIYPGSLQVPDPYCYRCFYGQQRDTCGLMCVDRIDDFIRFASTGQVAAVVIEPISGNGGNIVPPDGYLQQLRAFCDERDIILIFDEIQTGIGRTGRMFAADHFDVEPDAMTLAKGLGGSGAQVAAILTNERLSGLPIHHHSFTYGSNVLAAAAANATLGIVCEPDFLSNVRSVGDHIMWRLTDLQRSHSAIGDVRGVGLMLGVEMIQPDGSPAVSLTNAMAKAAMRHGLILRTSGYGHGNVVKIRPPLILTHAEADDICDRFAALLEEETA